MEFTAGSTRMCVDIDIPDDRLPEEDETFTVIIMPDPRVNPGPDGDSTVTILDNGNCIYVACAFYKWCTVL